MIEFTIKQGDRLPALTMLLESIAPGAGPVAVDLTGCTVKLVMALRKDPTQVTIVGVGTIVGSPTLGTVSYTWGASDTATAGIYDAEWHVTNGSGLRQKVPTNGFFTIYVEPGLSETTAP